MGESRKKALQSYIDRLLKLIEFNVAVEDDFIHVAHSFEASRIKWQQAEKELREKQEILLRCEIERSALQVKLKHARNQVDVEMKRRQRVETELQTVERQMQLIGELIQNDGQTVAPLSDSVLAFFGGPKTATHGAGNRLSTGESCGSFLSDISYDQTEDDLDLDELAGRPVRLKPRERRRSSLAPLVTHFAKKSRSSLSTAVVTDNIKETVMAKTTMFISEEGPIQAKSSIESVQRRRSGKSRPLSALHEPSSVLPQINENDHELDQDAPPPTLQVPGQTHVFLSKTMIRAEQCSVCGHKTRFGKMSLKCRNCRILIHPECRDYCPKQCPPVSLPVQNIGLKKGQILLSDFAPVNPPMVPMLVVQCVNEIEKRGLSERGLYRISGCDRQVKEMKQKLLYGKIKSQQMSKEDPHTICSILKDFLRSLHEPLLTFSLHAQFLDAADILNESDSKSEICQAVQDLPPANRDTLAFLILHLYRVMRSPECQMDKMNLARVLGPTIVGHSVPDPSPLMIMQDTPRQAKVMSLLLSLPSGFWNQFLSNNQENQHCDSVTTAQERLFRPLTSPEMNSALAAPLKPSARSPFLTDSASKSDLMRKPGRFFTSPNN